MKIFDLDSPLMNFLGKMADLMWLNILTIICCIPIVTAGAGFTALHYMTLKIVRNEECYITKGYLKSFKENFKQATLIWLLMLLVAGIIIGDYYIILNSEIELHTVFKVIIMAVTVMILFVAVYVFPVLAKFDNSIKRTIVNSFVMSILQFPRTIVMIILWMIPVVLLILFFKMIPIVFLFGFSAPALGCAFLCNKFFKKLENQILEANASETLREDAESDERIFKDELAEEVTIEKTM